MEEYRLDGKTVKEHLLHLSEYGNKPFTKGLHPGVEHILGIRIPDLRKLAARIAKRKDWKDYLETAGTFYMEERMLQGMVLGYIRPDEKLECYLDRVSRFVRLINSWSVCDTFKFAGGKRFVEKHRQSLWKYLVGWMHAKEEYEIRFGVVMSMTYFIEPEYIDELLLEYDRISHEGYYVKMAVAWALSVCMVKFPEKTLHYLQYSHLDDFTYNKSIQKMIESYRITDAQKQVLRQMRRSTR